MRRNQTAPGGLPRASEERSEAERQRTMEGPAGWFATLRVRECLPCDVGVSILAESDFRFTTIANGLQPPPVHLSVQSTCRYSSVQGGGPLRPIRLGVALCRCLELLALATHDRAMAGRRGAGARTDTTGNRLEAARTLRGLCATRITRQRHRTTSGGEGGRG